MEKKRYLHPSTRICPFCPDLNFCESDQENGQGRGEVEHVEYVNWLDLLS